MPLCPGPRHAGFRRRGRCGFRRSPWLTTTSADCARVPDFRRPVPFCRNPRPARMVEWYLLGHRLARLCRLGHVDGDDRISRRQSSPRCLHSRTPRARVTAVSDRDYLYRIHRASFRFCLGFSGARFRWLNFALAQLAPAQLIAVAINMFLPRLLPMINSAALIWSLAGAFTIFIVTLATASPNYQRGAFVFGGWQNETGWPSKFVSLLRPKGVLKLTDQARNDPQMASRSSSACCNPTFA